MTRWIVSLGALGFGVGVGLASEPPRGCFVSMAEAAAQTRALDPANVSADRAALGFRLEDLRQDRLLERRWAIVRSCDHPERPPVAVVMAGNEGVAAGPGWTPGVGLGRVAAAAASPVVRAGSRVRVIGGGQNVRFETMGVVQSNGVLGERVRVRLLASAGLGDGSARIVAGTVRGTDLLELEP